MSLREDVFNRRRELGLSQKDVAEALGVSSGCICKIEKGLTKPSSSTANKLIELLQMDKPANEKYLTGDRTIDLAMLEKRVNSAIFELELVLDILREMKGESHE